MTNPCAEVFITVESVLKRYPIRNPEWKRKQDVFILCTKDIPVFNQSTGMFNILDPWNRRFNNQSVVVHETPDSLHYTVHTTVLGFNITCVILID